jgi:hypothetical protein
MISRTLEAFPSRAQLAQQLAVIVDFQIRGRGKYEESVS